MPLIACCTTTVVMARPPPPVLASLRHPPPQAGEGSTRLRRVGKGAPPPFPPPLAGEGREGAGAVPTLSRFVASSFGDAVRPRGHGAERNQCTPHPHGPRLCPPYGAAHVATAQFQGSAFQERSSSVSM